MKKIRIGFCGAGTVGRGAMQILADKREVFLQRGLDFEISKVLVKDISKKRDFLPKECQLVSDYRDISEADDIDLVIEVIGGVDIAKDIVFSAIQNGKNTITANKALIAGHFNELFDLLNANPFVNFGFEAAVGGGLPLIATLQQSLMVDNVRQIVGILNGTTNFILSKMESESADYTTVLKEAQDLGFAEADPTADVEGYDARSKILILAQLVTGHMFDTDSIYMNGITNINSLDFKYANELNATIKLLGVYREEEGKVSFVVSPFIVPRTSAIAHVHGPKNIAEISADYTGKTTIIGFGAGDFPTGNSIVTDLLRISETDRLPHFNISKGEYDLIDEFRASYYIRISSDIAPELIKKLCDKNNINISSLYVFQTEVVSGKTRVLVTEESLLSSVISLVSDITNDVGKGADILVMPIWEA